MILRHDPMSFMCIDPNFSIVGDSEEKESLKILVFFFPGSSLTSSLRDDESCCNWDTFFFYTIQVPTLFLFWLF